MKFTHSRRILAALGAALLLAQAACTNDAPESGANNPALAEPVPDGMVRGTVVETMDSAGYTYVLLTNGQDQLWFAGPVTAVKVGDVLQASTDMPMTEFTSNSLERSFDVIFFSGTLENLSAPAPVNGSGAEPVTADVEVAPVEEGKDIAWVYANKADLAGQTVTLRGEVVKYNSNILGRNFLHIQDGSGDAADGTNDLTVTSEAQTAVGQNVVVTGTIVLDMDFSAGYTFPVLMEGASITVEP